MLDLQTVTPYNIDEMSFEDVLGLIKDSPDEKIGKKARLKLIQVLYQILGFDLSPDIALALAANPKVKTIVAVAGSGKTSMTQVAVIVEKLLFERLNKERLYGVRVLCLVYNTHNVDPMGHTHWKLVNKIRQSGIANFDIDDKISATTLHSFCDGWRSEYETELGMANSKLQKDTDAQGLMKDCFGLLAKKTNIEVEPSYPLLFRIYNYAKERMLDFDNEEVIKSFPELQLDLKTVATIFKLYESLKSRKKVYDYIDQLTSFKHLIETNEQARYRIHSHYDIVVADENQDSTPLMQEIIRLIVGDKKHIRVGDEDQLLYEFKGVEVETFLDYEKIFPGSECYVLTTNRRCGRNIVDAAAAIIEQNKLRFKKKLLASNPGGVVKLIGYSSEEGQVLSIINQLENLTYEELCETGVAYRDKIYSTLITEKLEERDIPFYVLSGYGPFSHELYYHVRSILDLLYSPYDAQLQLNLFKVLPSIKRSDMEKVLGYNSRDRRFSHSLIPKHFAELDFGHFTNINKFYGTLTALKDVSDVMNVTPMKEYFGFVFKVLRDYYWNWKMEYNEENNRGYMDQLFTEKVFKLYNSDKTYDNFYREYADRISKIRRWEESKSGVAIGTFHSLKGLEFDRMYLTYLADNIIPSTDIGRNNPTEEERERFRESENRAMYVAMTRARKELYNYYPVDNPSVYIKLLQDHLNSKQEETIQEDATTMEVFKPSTVSPSASSSFFGRFNK